MDITRRKTEVTKRQDTTIANIMRRSMGRRAITIKATITTTTRAIRLSTAMRSTTHMKKTMLRRVANMWARNGHTALVLGVESTELDTVSEGMHANMEAMLRMVTSSVFVGTGCLHGQYYRKYTDIFTLAGIIFLCLKMRLTL
jgi:uncharacterized protein YaaQ